MGAWGKSFGPCSNESVASLIVEGVEILVEPIKLYDVSLEEQEIEVEVPNSTLDIEVLDPEFIIEVCDG